jgi:hypothetical protein
MAQARQVEHYTTQFSCGRMVLRSGGPNHINHCVHRVHIELTTKRLKVFSIKELQRVAPIAAPVKVSQNHFDMYRDGSMGRSRRERDRQILVWIPAKKYLSGLTGRAAEQEEARQVPGHQAAMANARASVLLPHTSRATGKRADVLRWCHGSPLGLIYR